MPGFLGLFSSLAGAASCWWESLVPGPWSLCLQELVLWCGDCSEPLCDSPGDGSSHSSDQENLRECLFEVFSSFKLQVEKGLDKSLSTWPCLGHPRLYSEFSDLIL